MIGRADWNDCLNLNCFSSTPGESFQTTTNQDGVTAESVFIAGLFVLAAEEMAQIAELAGNADEAAQLRADAAEMTAAVDKAGWDGEWFRRAYDNFSRPIGSHWNGEGQIFIEPQGMCVMAGIGAGDGRARQALDSVRARLATPHGIVLQQPAYSQYYLHLGEISSYPPGYKENASVFCHTNPWIMIAEAKLGDGDAAHDYYLRINPSRREEITGRGDPRRGEELVADGDCGVELCRDITVDPRHPGGARRAADRAGHSEGVAGLYRDARVPGGDVSHYGGAAGAGKCGRADCGRAGGRGECRVPEARRNRSEREGYAALGSRGRPRICACRQTTNKRMAARIAL